VPPLERQGDDAAERQSGHIRGVETQPLEEAGEAIRVPVYAEAFGGVGRATRPGRVPGYDCELVGEPVELRPPRRWSVSHIAVEEHERRPGSSAFVGDLESVDLDHIHGTSPRGFDPG
jgi:hypothetical protein